MNKTWEYWLAVQLEAAKNHPYAAIVLFHDYLLGKSKWIAGFGTHKSKKVTEWNLFPEFLAQLSHPTLGVFSYDLKNKFEKLPNANKGWAVFPEIFFFEPEYTEEFNGDLPIPSHPSSLVHSFEHPWKCLESQDNYFKNVELIKELITNGDFYELNYCVPFVRNPCIDDPYHTFSHLFSTTLAPFSIFIKMEDAYLLSASPERFIFREENTIHSFPIKGTAPRFHDELKDAAQIKSLMNSEKNKAENTMIVDLVRNDFSRICKPGSVKVPILHEVYSFSHVHQMISQVSGELKDEMSLENIIQATFPMGSMTGAPKIKVMENIDALEIKNRNAFSGAAGWIHPNGDFDLNVVIRSIIHQSNYNRTFGFAGGAITIDSNPHEEWDELMHKSKTFTCI